MVVQNPQHTYRKDGVYYYCRRVPKDLLFKYDKSRIVMSLRTKSITAARRSASSITSRLNALQTLSMPLVDGRPRVLVINMGKVTALA